MDAMLIAIKGAAIIVGIIALHRGSVTTQRDRGTETTVAGGLSAMPALIGAANLSSLAWGPYETARTSAGASVAQAFRRQLEPAQKREACHAAEVDSASACTHPETT